MSCVTFITYTERVSCVDYAEYSTCSASNDLLSFPHINNSRPRYGESSKGPKTPHHTATIQAGPDSTHEEPDYYLPILRMYAIQISPELRYMHHPTLYQHHPYMLALTSCIGAVQECPIWPYLALHYALLRDTEQDSTSPHRYGPYHAIYALSRPAEQKDSKMSHPLYTKLPHFSIFVRKFYFRPNFTH